jgi:AmmeMemoRadiSam system protein A
MDLMITNEEKRILLDEARETITAKLQGRKPSYQEFQIGKDSCLQMPCGAFVSLHTRKNRALRGCIGRMTANTPLRETVHTMAKEAAFSDPRFAPLKPEELDNSQIEISALSPMSPCSNPREVKVGVHGLLLRKGVRSGVLLPQVPVEQGWNLDEYLDYICIKAGLPRGSYEAEDAELYTFTAVVFGED